MSNTKEYTMRHRPTKVAPLFDLRAGAPDIYENQSDYINMRQDTEHGVMSKISFDIARTVYKRPEYYIRIYRSAPVGEINPGDWISLNPKYARSNAEEGDRLWVAQAKVKDIFWPADDINEMGYFGANTIEATEYTHEMEDVIDHYMAKKKKRVVYIVITEKNDYRCAMNVYANEKDAHAYIDYLYALDTYDDIYVQSMVVRDKLETYISVR